MRIIETYSTYGLVISVFALGILVTSAYAQNSTGTGTHDSISSLVELITAVGILLGAAGTVIGLIGNQRAQMISKYAQTFGQKTVENAHVIERVARASDALAEGKLSVELDKVQLPMDKITEHAKVATEQLNYLNNKDTLPKDPDKDKEMPRESQPMPRTTVRGTISK